MKGSHSTVWCPLPAGHDAPRTDKDNLRKLVCLVIYDFFTPPCGVLPCFSYQILPVFMQAHNLGYEPAYKAHNLGYEPAYKAQNLGYDPASVVQEVNAMRDKLINKYVIALDSKVLVFLGVYISVYWAVSCTY